MPTFKAYRTFEENGKVTSRFVDMKLDELDPGNVVVRTKYSTINYKDALSHNGTGRIMRKFPTVAGIDMSGTVETSSDPRWKKGDKVIVHAYDMGVAHDGGYAEYVRVPGDWIVRRPESMTAFDAMTLGTAGFTAAQAIHLMLHNGLAPASGPVAVTGATGGVGCVAVEILAKLGFQVVAITGKAAEESDWLKSIGAAEVLARQSIDLTKFRPLGAATYDGAVDNLGGSAQKRRSLLGPPRRAGDICLLRVPWGEMSAAKRSLTQGRKGGFIDCRTRMVPSGAWDAARTVDETIATTDQMILLPDYDAADTQDIMAIFWDASADEISRKLYDNSANSWSETSIATSMVDNVSTSGFPHFAVAPDITNTRHILVAWSGVDTLNADLRCWTVDASTITEVTNVVQNAPTTKGFALSALTRPPGIGGSFTPGRATEARRGARRSMAIANALRIADRPGG